MVRSSMAGVAFAGLSIALTACATYTWRDEAQSAIERGDYVSVCRLASQNQSDPAAFFRSGVCSEDGRAGIPQDIKAAIGYYTLAARYGIPDAQAQLARLGQPIPAADLAQRPQPGILQAIGAGFQGMGEVAREGAGTRSAV